MAEGDTGRHTTQACSDRTCKQSRLSYLRYQHVDDEESSSSDAAEDYICTQPILWLVRTPVSHRFQQIVLPVSIASLTGCDVTPKFVDMTSNRRRSPRDHIDEDSFDIAGGASSRHSSHHSRHHASFTSRGHHDLDLNVRRNPMTDATELHRRRAAAASDTHVYAPPPPAGALTSCLLRAVP